MENFLSALAFAGLIAAQFLSVVLDQTQRCDDQFLGTGIEKRASQRAGHPRNPLGDFAGRYFDIYLLTEHR